MENMVTVFLFGKKYEVPDSLTIMEAMEYSGYQLVRGCGCRNGFCGACATIYRIAGGIGLAPLHSVINYCRHYRDRYGSIDIVYGSRSKEDLVDFQEILDVWCKEDGINVHLTIDREQPEWDGHVGFVPNYVKELGFTTDKTVVMCGPPIMIKFTLAGLMELGFAREQVYTTMELKMKCALGKCGRCNIGNKYVCKDGPVFRFDQLDELPDEY